MDDTKTKSESSGAVKVRGRWYARIRLPSGGRRRFALPEGISEARAHDMANAMRERVRANPEKYIIVSAPKTPPARAGELTLRQYAERWFEEREARGLSSIGTDRGRMTNHVLPLLGDTAMVRVTPDDVRRVVEALDAKVQGGTITSATAVKVWGLVTKLFSDAWQAKKAALRVRKDNPCLGVTGPDREAPRAKQWLYPSEVQALLNCEEIPLRWRRLYALAAYLYLRPGELAALEWRDIDFDRGRVIVRQAFDLRSNTIKGLKTSRSGVKRRTVPMRTLGPLLRTLHTETGGTGLVVQHEHENKDAPHGLPPLEGLAATLREHLARAGVKRAELFETDDTSRRVVFYSLRHTGITWEVLADTEELRILQRAGHKNLKTTQGYVHAVEDVDLNPGEKPFAPLPRSLYSVEQVGHAVAQDAASNRNHSAKRASPTGFEPVLQP